MNRALLWLVGGLVVFVGLVVLIAPELLGDLGFATGAVGITLVAVVPGLLVMALFASSRRGRRIRRAERDAAADATARPDSHHRPTDPGA